MVELREPLEELSCLPSTDVSPHLDGIRHGHLERLGPTEQPLPACAIVLGRDREAAV